MKKIVVMRMKILLIRVGNVLDQMDQRMLQMICHLSNGLGENRIRATQYQKGLMI
jgi:hypothetical protein